ncbi:hypothetical protein BGW80DRAFT_1282384, partial [Lactifluus volemus]
PYKLQGLNLVQTPQPPESYLADSQDLLSLSQFPELSAQLDYGWQPAQADNHVNVEPRTASRPLNAFDIGNILATFGIDPFAVPVVPSTSATPTTPPPVPTVVESNTQSKGAKRARVRRSSVSKGTGDLSTDSGSPSPTDSQSGTMSTPLTAAEDKRRRNTAASARFRLKKKEREAALEKKSKELEMRVNELERECEGLRRENGWLKGLVVGVTGVGAAQQQSAPATAAGVKRPREATDTVGN